MGEDPPVRRHHGGQGTVPGEEERAGQPQHARDGFLTLQRKHAGIVEIHLQH